MRGHVCFRDELGARRPFAHGPPNLAFARPESPRARPPSPPLGPLRDVHAKRRQALLWVRLPPDDFCNCISDARTHSQAPDSRRSFERPAPAVTSKSALALAGLVGPATFPCRRRAASAASRDSPFEAGPTALQARRRTRPRKPPPNRDAACGRRLGPTAACGGGRWTAALDCASRVALSEGPSRPPPAAAGRRG